MHSTANYTLLSATSKGYRVLRCGAVRFQGELRKLNVDSRGYHRFTVRTKIGIRSVNVHRLQAFQKFGAAIFRAGIQVRHLDGNALNNAAANIAIGTCHDNQMDKPEDVRKRVAMIAAAARQRKASEANFKSYAKGKTV